MRLLTVDIETRPIEGYVWSLWDQNVGINQIKDPGALLCFAAKWHGEQRVQFMSEWEHGRKRMAQALYRLFDEAEGIVGWNSDKFDIRWIFAQFLEFGLSKPSPFAKIDLMKSVKRQVYLPSYKLDYVAQWLGIGRKIQTGGFDLWRDVLNGDAQARAKMRRYNIQDVRLTEQVLDRLTSKGWVLGLPNASISGGMCCTNPMCGGERLQARGFQITKTRKYQRWQCKDCGSWGQSVRSMPGSAEIKPIAA
jgi:DNA polymerase elongation subunit (family B)